jgi:hypothetical protein
MSTHRNVIIEPAIKPVESALSEPIPPVTHSQPIDIKYPVRDGNVYIPMYQKELLTRISDDNVVIQFSDFTSHIISRSIYEQYPKLQDHPIKRTRNTFISYILPIINGDRLIMKSVDTFEELSEIINEINYYEIKLTKQQVVDIHISAGIVELIQKIKMKYFRKMGKCMNSEFKNRLKVFSDYWDTLIDKFAEFKKDDDFKKIKFDIIMKIIENGSVFDLLSMNIYYENQISIFFKFFKAVVFDNSDSEIVQLIENIGASLPKVLQTTEDIIFGTIDAMTGNKAVSSVVRSVIDATRVALESNQNVLRN